MTTASKKQIIETLLILHGVSFAQECDIELRDSPEPLFRLLVASMLAGAPVRPAAAAAGARTLFEAGLTSAAVMRKAPLAKRLRILRDAGYPRFTERAARAAGDLARELDDAYGGDLRAVRDEASGDAELLGHLLKGFSGIGTTAASIFVSEVQLLWDEYFPTVTDRAAEAADALGLPVERLDGYVSPNDFPRLVAALARCEPAAILKASIPVRLRARP